MTKPEALYNFFSSFGMTAYPANAVPEDTVFPWLTYEAPFGSFDDGPMPITVNLWFHTESEAVPYAKAEQIAQAIGEGGVTLPCDRGLIWVKKGTPFCQSVNDEADSSIKRRYINLTLEYLTT